MHELIDVTNVTQATIGRGDAAVVRYVAIAQVMIENGRFDTVTFQKYGDRNWSELYGGKYILVEDDWFVEVLEAARENRTAVLVDKPLKTVS